MSDFEVRPLDADSWEAWAVLAEAHGGVWNGCWCVSFHQPDPAMPPKGEPAARIAFRRAWKASLVRAGESHSAVVFDGDEAIGWAQFGRTAELPRIEHRRRYEEGLAAPPDWRIPCMFVGRGHRRQGVAEVALLGALELIAAEGGGVVEAYPEDTNGRTPTASFMWGGTVRMFERNGFVCDRQIGKHHWVVRRDVAASSR